MRAPSHTHRNARRLRQDMSLPEVLLWARLRHRQPGVPRCRRQHPIGPYVLDFYFSEAKLAIEVDGYSHGTATARNATPVATPGCASRALR
jgi:very-short-patch-repair endonuclease